jgi:NTP pyrophosphatase (non-canonical NTP hydrolase)
MNDVVKIMAMLSPAERLTQLAEECAELGQAALKLRRALTGINPTPVEQGDAASALMEETADVLLCMAAVVPGVEADLSVNWMIGKIVKEKAARWADRLRARERNEGNAAAAGKGDDLSRRCAPPSPEGEGKGNETERERGHINQEPDRDGEDGEDGEAVDAEMIMEAKRELVHTVIEAITALLSI